MTPASPLGGVPGQIGILVADIEAAMTELRATCGLTPWMVNTMSAARAHTWRYRRGPGTFRMHAALCGEQPQIELLQPLDGPSVYDEWVQEHGWGVHHLGFFVEGLDARIEEMAALGYDVIQEGRGFGVDGDGGYAYFDTGPRLGVIYEAIERPRARRPPDRWWPASPRA